MSKHLNKEKRNQIQAYVYEGHKPRIIAKLIGYTKKTVCRELKIFKDYYDIPYNAELAQELHNSKRGTANKEIHGKLLMETDLTQYIDKYFIGEYRSPEQIAGKWNLGHKDKKEKHITHPTIYDYIYAKYDKEILKKCMRRKGKKYKHGKRDKTKIPNRVNIDQRPEEANTRSEFGHMESDTIIGKNKKDRIGTTVDRKTRFLCAELLIRDHKDQMMSVILSVTMTQSYLRQGIIIKTNTFDNGVEFADHEAMSEIMDCKHYFANPYHSRERGTNEYMNGLLRQFLPKKTDFSKVTKEELASYVELINTRPMKCLGWQSPKEVFLACQTNKV